jgi:hypothetical protein
MTGGFDRSLARVAFISSVVIRFGFLGFQLAAYWSHKFLNLLLGNSILPVRVQFVSILDDFDRHACVLQEPIVSGYLFTALPTVSSSIREGEKYPFLRA